jgi:hypothetical protein
MTTSRRNFLKGASLATAPFILPSTIWAQATKPNDKPGMAFIGIGIQARGLLGNFLHQDVNVVAICDVDKTRREDGVKISGEADQPTLVYDFKNAVTEDPLFESVSLTGPSASKGKHKFDVDAKFKGVTRK